MNLRRVLGQRAEADGLAPLVDVRRILERRGCVAVELGAVALEAMVRNRLAAWNVKLDPATGQATVTRRGAAR